MELEPADLAECEEKALGPLGAAREVQVHVEGAAVVNVDEAKASHALARHSRSIDPACQYAPLLRFSVSWVSAFVFTGFVNVTIMWVPSSIIVNFTNRDASLAAQFQSFGSYVSFKLMLLVSELLTGVLGTTTLHFHTNQASRPRLTHQFPPPLG